MESILHDLCRELPARGWNPVLGLTRGTIFHNPERYAEACGPLPIIEIDGRAGTFSARRSAIVQTIVQIAPEVVVGARIFDAYPAVATLRGQGGDVRFVQMIRSCEADYLSDLRRYNHLVDVVAADGKLLTAAATSLCHMPPERVANIPGGVRVPSSFRSRRAGRPFRIGFAGRMDDTQKRTQDLEPFVRHLVAQGESFEIEVAGDGPALPGLRQKLADFPVRFHGWLDGQAFEEFLCGLDILVHFSPSEGVSILPREAMVRGVVPVISEFTGFWSEGHFRPGVNCLSFPVGQVEAAVEAAVRLFRDNVEFERLSENGKISQGGNYEFKASMQAWADCLSRVTQLPPLPVPVRKPSFPEDEGRLDRLPIPDGFRKFLRQFGHRKYGDPGAEWPHASGWESDEISQEFRKFALTEEKRKKALCVA